MNHGLSATAVSRLHEVFARHPLVEKAILYGSRAKETHKPGSDIDLTLQGQDLDTRELLMIEDEIEELLLPYTVDLSLLDQLDHAELREHIARVGREFYRRSVPVIPLKAVDAG
jgi:predicted nucleotidyltransferase